MSCAGGLIQLHPTEIRLVADGDSWLILGLTIADTPLIHTAAHRQEEDGPVAPSTLLHGVATVAGGCAESYQYVGRFEDVRTLVGALRSDFAGQCGDCVGQVWELGGVAL